MASLKTLTFSFDIGHSSIGWAVLSSEKSVRGQPVPEPTIEGCGSVIFPKDDCLASSRRSFRRTRRNIRSTRQRIERLKRLLAHLGGLTQSELDAPGHSAPHFLAAKALNSAHPTLDWQQLWHILRWYAHNRGYDGNSRWSRQEADDEGDTEKEKAALEVMGKHGTETMAETICAVLGLKINEKKISSSIPYKTLDAAFPRQVVRNEVLAILEKHKGHLTKLDDAFIDTLIARNEARGQRAWNTIPVPEINLPRRYFGGLLFGQLIPRFDNRIIAKCPISGDKVPNKANLTFLHYRWAMLLANIRVDGKPLTAEQRQAVHQEMEERGRLTPTELHKIIKALTGFDKNQTNIAASFEIHPDSKDALELDPALGFFRKAADKPTAKSTGINLFWKHLPEIAQKRALGHWKKNRPVDLQWMLDQCHQEQYDSTPLSDEIEKQFAKDQTKKKPAYLSRDHFLRRRFAPKALSGRAPYSRKVMEEVLHFVLNTERHPSEKGGPIYRSPEILKAERNRPIDDLTNNHLIRHRLTILLRLVEDMIENYADNDANRITDIVIEVARDLQEYSGLTAKEMAGELTKRLSHFKSAVDYLAKHAPDLEVTGSLIRKCRIAMDLDWRCPFTGKKYDPYELSKLEREHIIPYAVRPTNSLDSLVLTFDWVNRLKGKRTAFQFINDVVDDERFLSPKNYKAFVDKLKVARKETYPDDFNRQSRRKKLMMVEHYEAKDHGFTQGALTKTSHLNRLSARQLEKRFTNPETGEINVRITSIPGQVTAETRKGWRLLHTLNTACPDCEGKNKTEIRDLTHLHHALDASVLALTQHYLPGTLPGQSENEKGAIWAALLRRNKSLDQINLLLRTGLFAKHYKKDRHGTYELEKNGQKKIDVHLEDLPVAVKNNLAARLAEQRVVQHIPADQSGASLELNPWRVWKIEGDPNDPHTSITLRQKSSTVRKDGRREIKRKFKKEKAGKLIGLKPGKLSRNKAVLIISENYGLALDPIPQIIPFHKVSQRLIRLWQENDQKDTRILRNGMLIRVTNWPGKEGVWKVYSCKANLKLNLGLPQGTFAEWENVLVTSLLKKNAIEILSPPLTGITPPDLP
jgi:CRISPR-associated endonuclease Csn1